MAVTKNTETNSQIMTLKLTDEVGFWADIEKSVLNLKGGDNLVQTITSANQPFLFEGIISCRIQDIAAEIAAVNIAEPSQRPYLKLKTEELIHCLSVGLAKQTDIPVQMINSSDAKMIYGVKDKILAVIDEPPKLKELAKFSGMSQSKLQRLFKQFFGNSIYNYHQSFRMQKAAYLIKEERISVSEVGYRLGFSNLSHFARVFESHIGLKPKKYAITNRWNV